MSRKHVQSPGLIFLVIVVVQARIRATLFEDSNEVRSQACLVVLELKLGRVRLTATHSAYGQIEPIVQRGSLAFQDL